MAETNTYPTYPGWETVRKIGAGSFGAVYEIERDLLGRKEKAALKVLSVPQGESDVEELYSNGYDDASITEHFRSCLEDIVREYQLMADMKGHTNIVYCDDIRYVQKDDGFGWNIYIKMELLTPLTKIVDSRVSEEQAIKLGLDISNALALCLSRNIIHRDIKPQNIFVSRDGDYKLGDFGIAKTVEKTSGGTKIGTYNYMAPEVYNNDPYGHAADIYSLGLVMYWMLNERRMPFVPLPPAVPKTSDMENARLRRFRGDKIPAPLHGSRELKRIVLKACAYDPKDRYHTAEEMRADLLALGGNVAATESGAAAMANDAGDAMDGTVVLNDMGTVNLEDAGTVLLEDSGTVYLDEPGTVRLEDYEAARRSSDAPKNAAATPKPAKKKASRGLVIGIAAVVAVALLAVAGLLFLKHPTETDLETSNSVIFGSVTFLSDGSIELTPLVPNSAGSIWYNEPLDTRTGFNVKFSYWVGGGGNDGWDPSDGFTCSFSNHLGLGETGNLLGFYEEEGNYGVEFDTVPYPYGPNDPAFPHIAVIKGSTNNHLNYCAADYICDSKWHNVSIRYKPSEGLTIYVDDDLKLSNPEVKLNDSAYVGFTAATGAGVDRHLIRDISISVG